MGLFVVVGLAFVWWMASPPKDDGSTPVDLQAGAALPLSELVGSAKCAECHRDQAADHARSGHSHTFAFTKDSPVAMALCGQEVPTPDGSGHFAYECDGDGLMVSLPERFGDKRFPIEIALGSGAHAVTFLTLTEAYDADEGRIGVEHAYTWFNARGELGVTPGQEHWIPERDIEHFGKSHQGVDLTRCIDCHTTTFELDGARLSHVVPSVQCEQCHGPGRAHVEAAELQQSDRLLTTIRRSQNVAEEIALCGTCHRLPQDVTADRLKRYPPSVSRFQPIGLLQSRCYLESPDELTCTTCHATHGPAADRSLIEHVAVCQGCHREGQSALCAAGHTDQCIDCHMRPMELIPGIVFRDHWIRRRPNLDADADPADVPTVSGEPAQP